MFNFKRCSQADFQTGIDSTFPLVMFESCSCSISLPRLDIFSLIILAILVCVYWYFTLALCFPMSNDLCIMCLILTFFKMGSLSCDYWIVRDLCISCVPILTSRATRWKLDGQSYTQNLYCRWRILKTNLDVYIHAVSFSSWKKAEKPLFFQKDSGFLL